LINIIDFGFISPESYIYFPNFLQVREVLALQTRQNV